MDKDYDDWNLHKKRIEESESSKTFYEREVWRVKFGLNIGSEINGRHEFYLRPAIVIRKFNKDMLLVVPTTTQDKNNKYYLDVEGVEDKIYKSCVSQIKTISSKRLLRKIDTINKNDYLNLLNIISKMGLKGL
jgi:mRNA interferase MazF